MNQGEETLLSHIREARERRETTTPKAEELGVGIEGAYRIQVALGEGREVIGYKMGLISPAKQAQMGVDSPIYGLVYDDMILTTPVQLGTFLQPRLEPELAVILGEDLPPEASPGTVHSAIGGIFVAIDFLSSVWADYEFGAADVVADNVSGGGFLLGERLLNEPLEGTAALALRGRWGP
jgi:2-keto-4-pentenoate hydratase